MVTEASGDTKQKGNILAQEQRTGRRHPQLAKSYVLWRSQQTKIAAPCWRLDICRDW